MPFQHRLPMKKDICLEEIGLMNRIFHDNDIITNWENAYQRSLNQCYKCYNLVLRNEGLNSQSSFNRHQIFILFCSQLSKHQIINMYFLVIKNECSRKYHQFVPSLIPFIQIFNCSYKGQNAWFLQNYLIFYYAKLFNGIY